MNAIVTLCTNELFVEGAVVWAHSLLATGPECDVRVCIPPSLASNATVSQIFDTVGVPTLVIPSIEDYSIDVESRFPQSANSDEMKYRYRSVQSKCQIFSKELWKYDLVMFVDCDCLFTENVEYLFDYGDGSMLANENNYLGHPALFIIHPDEYYTELAYEKVKQKNVSDIDLITYAISNRTGYKFNRIPYKDNIVFVNGNHLYNDLPIIHYDTPEKPWLIGYKTYLKQRETNPFLDVYMQYRKMIRERFSLSGELAYINKMGIEAINKEKTK